MISPTTLALGIVVAEHRDLKLARAGLSCRPRPARRPACDHIARPASSAGPSSLRSCALLMPTDEPRFAGFTNSGYLQRRFDLRHRFARRPLPLRAQQRDVLHDGQPCLREEPLHHVLVHARGRAQHARADVGDARQLEQSLNGAVLAEGAVQHRKDHIERAFGRRRPWRAPGWRSSVGMPSCNSFAPGVVAGSPARSRRSSAGVALLEQAVRIARASQRPSLVMPMGTTSNFLRSIAFRIEAADSSETSCSPLRPPKRMPTRSFLAIALFHHRAEGVRAFAVDITVNHR